MNDDYYVDCAKSILTLLFLCRIFVGKTKTRERTMRFRTGRLLAATMLAQATLVPLHAFGQTQQPALPVTAQSNQASNAINSSTGASAADQTSSNTSGDIIVTAQKRSESVQNVPISITALAPAELAATNITTVVDLVRVTPGFTAGRPPQLANTRLNIRGIGAAGRSAIDPSVAAFVDDVYIARPGAIIGNFFDIAGIEVLRGPQGTLFGRNASAGAISIHSQQPTQELGGYLNVEYGNYNQYRTEGAVNLPATDQLAVRVAGLTDGFDGYGYTTYGNHRFGDSHTYAGRISAKYTPSADVTLILRADYMKVGGDGLAEQEILPSTLTPAAISNLSARLGGRLPDLYTPFDHVTNALLHGNLNDRQYAFSSDLSLNVLSGYTLRLLDSYRRWQDDQADGDINNLPIDLTSRRASFDSSSQSHELQFISPSRALLGGHLDFVSGLYFFQERYRTSENLDYGAEDCSILVALARPSLVNACLTGPQYQATHSDFSQLATSYAAYGQATFWLTDKLRFVAGLRYTHDDKDATFVQVDNNVSAILSRAPESTALTYSNSHVTYRLNLSYKPSSNVLVFATHSTGYKSGGFNSENGAIALGQKRIFNPETVSNSELGVKADVFDRKVTFDLTLYRMDVVGLQDRTFDGTTSLVRNAGNLRQQGFEFQSVFRPLATVSVDASLAYLDSNYTSYPEAAGLPGFGGTQNLAGKPNNYSPEFQGDVGLQYEGHLGESGWKTNARTDVTFITSEYVGATTDANPQDIQNGYALLSASITFTNPGDRWSFGVYGSNLTDHGYCTYIAPQVNDLTLGLRNSVTGGTVQRCTVAAPRTFGVRAGFKF